MATPATVLQRFDEAALRHPEKVAIYWGTELITYRQLQQSIDACAGRLQHLAGIKPGMRVGLLLKNCPQFIYTLYAILKSGATAVPINNFLKTPEVQHIADDCRLDCLVTQTEFAEVSAGLKHLRILQLSQLADQPPFPAVKVVPQLEDLAVIIYTSGTTGKSKGALLTHGNFAANVNSCVQALEETAHDRVTLLLPMFHSFMLTVCIFTPLSTGAGIILIKSVQPFKLALQEIIQHQATIFAGIPQIFQMMAQSDLPCELPLRMAISGAAPLPRETLETFEKKYRFPLLEGYGLSEAAPVVSFNPLRGTRKAGSVGLPVRDVLVKIVDDHGHELPPDRVGEIVTAGPNVMLGYHNEPTETAATLRNGWLHTGDMGKKDADGYLYIVDRRKEMFLARGMNVYPREIEEVLYTFPGIHEAAVVPRPDDKRGEAATAFVSPNEGATLDPTAILRHCRERLADYKLPREVRILAKLPRNATGKIAKLELKKLL